MQNDAPLKTPEFKPPGACASMNELRDAIDVLDSRLVALLAVRQAYIERAAQLKTDRGQVRDVERVEEVVAKVIAEGRRSGLSAEIAEPVWRTLIEASIRHEFDAFDRR
ncbi:MAG TPA: chorismate mutase [Rhizomicrobium sp.]|nr:chorismate mutase [Rhizomicrobium sp.]